MSIIKNFNTYIKEEHNIDPELRDLGLATELDAFQAYEKLVEDYNNDAEIERLSDEIKQRAQEIFANYFTTTMRQSDEFQSLVNTISDDWSVFDLGWIDLMLIQNELDSDA